MAIITHILMFVSKSSALQFWFSQAVLLLTSLCAGLPLSLWNRRWGKGPFPKYPGRRIQLKAQTSYFNISELIKQGSCSSQGSWLILKHTPHHHHGKVHHPPDWSWLILRKTPPRHHTITRCTIDSKHEWEACGKPSQGNGQAGKDYLSSQQWCRDSRYLPLAKKYSHPWAPSSVRDPAPEQREIKGNT